MRLAHAEPLSHGGKEYEIRVFSDGYNLTVKAFDAKTNKEANGFSRSITFPTAWDFKAATGIEPMKWYIHEAKLDITEGRWEQFEKSCIELQKANKS